MSRFCQGEYIGWELKSCCLCGKRPLFKPAVLVFASGFLLIYFFNKKFQLSTPLQTQLVIPVNASNEILNNPTQPPKFNQYDQMKWQLRTTHGDPSATCLNASKETFQHALIRQQQGIIRIYDDNGQLNISRTWTMIPQHFNEIWHEHLSNVDLLKLDTGEEQKYFIAFAANAPKPHICNIITLGVGHTVTAEAELKRVYPECSLIAVDVAAEINADIVRQIGGHFIEAAVGGKTADGELVHYWGANSFQFKTINQIGIRDFLLNYTNGFPVDLLLVDIEGAEFGVLEQIVEPPLPLEYYDQFPVPICQLNIEVHNPNMLMANYTHQQFFDNFENWMRQGQFALLHTEVYADGYPHSLFLRLFLINVKDITCKRNFFC